MSEANVINTMLAAGVLLGAVGAGARFGWEVGAMVAGGLMLSLAIWAVRIKRGA